MKNSRLFRPTAVFLAAALALSAALPAPASDASPADPMEERLVVRKLDNGLTVLIYPRPGAPVLSAIIAARVGSVDEPAGQTGVAHMMEHMAFKGTERIGTESFEAELPALEAVWKAGRDMTAAKVAADRAQRRGEDGAKELAAAAAQAAERLKEAQLAHRELMQKAEIDRLYSTNGGTGMNASTSPDFTTYYIDLPANKLELWALIESQRFAKPVLREFYIERDVVAEERRMRTDGNPFGKAYEALMAQTFIAHPYRNPTIGWMSDVQALTKEDAERFFLERYAPQNMAIALVGGVDAEKAADMVERYFGRLPAKADPPEVNTVEPEQIGERRATVVMPGSPAVAIAFRKKALPHREDVVMDVIKAILAGGETTRLHKRLVKDEEIAAAVAGFVGPGYRYDNAIIFYAVPRSPHTTEDCEEAIYEELERLANEPVAQEELDKVFANMKADQVRGTRGNQELAVIMAYSYLLTGDALQFRKNIQDMETVTPEEIQQVAKRVFAETRRNVVTLEPAPTFNPFAAFFGGGGGGK